MVSEVPDDTWVAAYDALVGAFGEPSPVTSGFRWTLRREQRGNQVLVELTVPATVASAPVVWIFDPNAVGLSTFSTVDVSSSDGLAWLEAEVRRLQRG